MTISNVLIGRPWYLSLTAVWKDAVGFEDLEATLFQIDLLNKLPGHQQLIRRSRWHSTVFAIAKINGWQTSEITAEENAIKILKHLLDNYPDAIKEINDYFNNIILETFELTCYDTVTSIQFREIGSSLTSFRNIVKDILYRPISEICYTYNNTEFAHEFIINHSKNIIDPLIEDKNKNVGGNAFGSVARSTYPKDQPVVRWREHIRLTHLDFQKIYLLQSDEMLTNPKALSSARLISSKKMTE